MGENELQVAATRVRLPKGQRKLERYKEVWQESGIESTHCLKCHLLKDLRGWFFILTRVLRFRISFFFFLNQVAIM
ncbi:unnamed protein product [Ixodes persulcatus]